MADTNNARLYLVGALMLGVGFLAGMRYGGRGDQPIPPRMVAEGCEHDYTSNWECPDSIPNLFANAADILELTVRANLRSGEVAEFTTMPGTDAVFLTRGSVENFLLRYYDAVDPAKATELRERLGPR